MDNGNEFRLIHISDLHFSEGTDLSNPAHTHSVAHLAGLEKAIASIGENDFVVISGDVSNHGDKQSLINASGYLFDTIPIGEGKLTGLKLRPEQCGVVPGNHDAWNAKVSGPLLDRRQRSLENYNFAFNNHTIPPKWGSYYRWIEKGNDGLYMAFVDSCFLGDTEENTNSAFGTIRYDQAIAKGKLSVEQTEKLLEWHDLGMKGGLQKSDKSGKYIDKDKFAQSLKILVMHHYLFEPPGHASDYFMRVKHRDVVFRNVAMADFDIMLCGHKHIPAFDIHSYGHHFDGRAVNRYLINCFRRMIGLHSLPIQLEDEDGKRWSKALTMISNILMKLVKKKAPCADSKKVADGVIELLKAGLENPEELEKNLKTFLLENGISGSQVLEKGELKDIRKRISIGLTVNERKQLRVISKKVMGISKTLKSKPFIQAMSGSSVKSSGGNGRLRCFNQFIIIKKSDGWKIHANRYLWDNLSNNFDVDNPVETEHYVRKTVKG